MNRLIFALATVATLCATSAFAAESCEAQADGRKLAGAARSSFVKKCEKDHPPADAAACEARAADKKLAGAARSSFLKKCGKDVKADGARAGCEAQAVEKKLAGAARNSFVTKCVGDAAAA